MTQEELNQKYPAYSKSIFSDFMPDDPEVMGWQENVLQKVKGNSILPHYIEKNRDFDTFWGWITHFFAIIVYFSRNFRKIFTNYTEYLDEIGEFMRERDYIQDSRIQINEDLKIPIAEKIYYKINIGQRLINGVIKNISGFYCSDFIVINSDNLITLSVGGYNKSTKEFFGQSVNNIDIAFFDKNKQLISYLSTFLNNIDSICGKKIQIPINNSITYFKVSYPRLGNSNLPLYLNIYRENVSKNIEETRSEEDIFSIFKDFRKRGTFKGNLLIKKILETKQEDNFFADYIPQSNSGWFLNQNSPTVKRLYENIKIDSFCSQSLSNSGYNSIIYLKPQYFLLNQNTSLIVKWVDNFCAGTTVTFDISVYDKNKNLLTETPILGNWFYDSSKKILRGNSVGYLIVTARKGKYGYEAELPINIINNKKSALFSVDTYDRASFKDIYLFTKFNDSGTKEAYYLKINSITIYCRETYPYLYDNGNNQLLDNGNNELLTTETNFVDKDLLLKVDIGLYLKNLPITFGFLNNKQYYLCCFKNNGSYSNAEAAEIIGQKVIPYNGYRVFVDNSLYKDNTTIALDLKNIYFDKIFKKIHLEIIGGVPPYSYQLGYLGTPNQDYQAEISYLQTYEKRIITYGLYKIVITDALGKKILVRVSCQPFNNIDYKFRLFVSRDNSIQIFLKLFGGTETSYNVSKYIYSYPYLYDNGNNQLLDNGNNELLSREITIDDEKITMPANVWIDITKVIGSNFNQIAKDMNLYIRDNGIPVEARTWLIDEYNDLELNLQELLCDFALDFYDNGVGELVN